MSLISVARRVRSPRTLTRTVLAVLVVSAAIIAGLLAMHSFNSHATTPGHHDAVAVSSQSQAPGDHHDVSSAVQLPAAPMSDAGCATCGAADPMTWMACVLALLVATILFTRIAVGWRHATVASILAGSTTHPPARAHTLPTPPSLTVLCISRT